MREDKLGHLVAIRAAFAGFGDACPRRLCGRGSGRRGRGGGRRRRARPARRRPGGRRRPGRRGRACRVRALRPGGRRRRGRPGRRSGRGGGGRRRRRRGSLRRRGRAGRAGGGRDGGAPGPSGGRGPARALGRRRAPSRERLARQGLLPRGHARPHAPARGPLGVRARGRLLLGRRHRGRLHPLGRGGGVARGDLRGQALLRGRVPGFPQRRAGVLLRPVPVPHARLPRPRRVPRRGRVLLGRGDPAGIPLGRGGGVADDVVPRRHLLRPGVRPERPRLARQGLLPRGHARPHAPARGPLGVRARGRLLLGRRHRGRLHPLGRGGGVARGDLRGQALLRGRVPGFPQRRAGVLLRPVPVPHARLPRPRRVPRRGRVLLGRGDPAGIPLGRGGGVADDVATAASPTSSGRPA